jgi:hypothetical protein
LIAGNNVVPTFGMKDLSALKPGETVKDFIIKAEHTDIDNLVTNNVA